MSGNKKISELTSMVEADVAVASDYLPIVDVSQTLASDRNKKITVTELGKAIVADASTFTPSGTELRSTTVSGALGEVETVIWAKLRRAVKEAKAKVVSERSSAYVNGVPALIGATAWAASTAYVAANQVSNGGNVYECTLAGTSASSGGPSGYGTGIVDGTAVWAYIGKQTAPQLSWSTSFPAGITNQYLFSDATNGAVSAQSVNFFGAQAGFYTSRYKFPTANQGVAGTVTGNYNNYFWAVEFMTDATELVVEQDPTSSQVWYVRVDGIYADSTGSASRTSGGTSRNIIDFTNTFGGARKSRRIQFESWGGLGLYSISVAKTEKIWKPTDSETIRAYFVGDSFVAGTGADEKTKSFWATASNKLGWRDVWADGSGSTGYINAGTHLKYADRVSDLIAAAPDVIVLTGGINDIGNTSSAVQTAVTSYLTTIRASLANTPIFVVGNFEPGTERSTATDVQTGISAAVTAMADSRIFFIPTLSTASGGAWITGTGKSGSTTGDGNADVYTSSDGTHPTQAGHNYLGNRVADAIRALIGDPT